MKKSLVILSVFAVGLSCAQKSADNPTFSIERENVKNTSHSSGDREFSSKTEKQDFIKQADPVKERTILPYDATFPKYINTGDKKADASNYAALKDEWVKNNSEKYEKMNSFSKKNAESIRARDQKRNINHKN